MRLRTGTNAPNTKAITTIQVVDQNHQVKEPEGASQPSLHQHKNASKQH